MRNLTRRNIFGVLAAGLAVLGLSISTIAGPEDDKVVAKVGEKAPEFVLKDLDGKEHKLSDYTKEGKIVVLEWFNADCPYVKKHHVANHTMAEHSKALKEEHGVVWLAINTGAAGKQGAGLERNKRAKADYKIEYPILLDPTGDVGRLYRAKTTPHMYVIGREGVLIYAGAIDNNDSPSRVGDVIYPVQAIKQHLAGETVTDPETTAYGCNVKY